MTDNGGSWRSNDLAASLERFGRRPRRTRPYTSRSNGKAKHCIKAILAEWTNACTCGSQVNACYTAVPVAQ